MHEVPLSIEHQEIISALWSPICQRYDLQFAEFSFANDFLFRREHQYTVIETDPPMIKGKFKNGCSYIIPTVPPKQLKTLCQMIKEEISCFFPMPEQWLEELKQCEFELNYNEGETDYLLTRDHLETLSGRKRSSRRNLLHQLTDHHAVDARPLKDQEKDVALHILDEWQKGSGLPQEKTDYYPCLDALNYLERLKLFGKIIYVDDKPAGFTIGELLTPHTALLHWAKASHNVKGVTPYLYQDFARSLPEGVEWVNLEQDLGLPHLRQAKKAYDPDKLLIKWRACETK